MAWRIAKLPDFVALDAAAMVAELVALQTHAIRQGVSDPDAYAEIYAGVFQDHDFASWVYLDPLEVARGITRIVREVGLFVLLDDSQALAHLARQATWRTSLPPVRAARPGPIYTASRAQQLENRAAFEALVHRVAVFSYAQRLPSLPLGPAALSERLRDAVIEIFNAAIEEATLRNDGALRQLRLVFATSLALINYRTHSPLEDTILVLTAPMPSLVCAHWAYREARQAQRLRDANPTAHPNFMTPRLVVPTWP
jgi:hypothetical protein